MAYLVRAQARIDGGHESWLGPPRRGGMRTFAPKEMAERFDSEASAKKAINTMRDKEDCRAIMFTVEPAE
ncbi:MAG TPA: hypothetical protein VGP63_16940 [Planctomycetaceae bacterium]|jgi:hypothetical protein|nr:hypothetical protein [Planctomycetaceae bacterium]